MTISRTFPTSDLEAFRVEAVANGWLVTLGVKNFHRGECAGEQFVFSSPLELAGWLHATLPRHALHQEKQ